jgi:hypothetical protein
LERFTQTIRTLSPPEVDMVAGGYSNQNEYIQMLYEAGGYVQGSWAYWPNGGTEWLPDLFPHIEIPITVIHDGYDAGGKPVYRIG